MSSSASGRGGQVADHGNTYAVRIIVDGRALPLKEFLHDMIGGAVHGLVGGLRGVSEPTEVAIEVTRR